MGLFGYTDAQWNAAKEEMRQALIHRAREEDTMSYTELRQFNGSKTPIVEKAKMRNLSGSFQ